MHKIYFSTNHLCSRFWGIGEVLMSSGGIVQNSSAWTKVEIDSVDERTVWISGEWILGLGSIPWVTAFYLLVWRLRGAEKNLKQFAYLKYLNMADNNFSYLRRRFFLVSGAGWIKWSEMIDYNIMEELSIN